jgi:hypothetical protein
MNQKDREYIEKKLKNNDPRDRFSKKGKRKKDIAKYGLHVTDHAIVRYLDRVLNKPVERYRDERIIPSSSIAKQIYNWVGPGKLRIKLSKYTLIIKRQSVVDIQA